MSRAHRWLRSLLVLPLTALGACGGPAPSEPVPLEDSLDPLRSDFEADAGKVRAIFLASPT